MSEEQLSFQAEVSRLLEIVVGALYADRDIFLRELISNASDSCDRLRYQAITEPGLLDSDPDFRITLTPDADAGTLTVTDNGLGMSRDDLVDNLGTIARSGSKRFSDALTGDAARDVKLIGQFGVGFYSAFMVADRVEVFTRKAGDAQGWKWVSDGRTGFTISDAGGLQRGARIVLHLKEDAREYLEPHRLRRIVQTYSDHIDLPVVLRRAGEDDETLNTASALWTRPKSEITEDQYREFYHHVAHAFDQPWHTIHYLAEGQIEFTALLFVPEARPMDLYDPTRRPTVKLYVRRVFISDDVPSLIPGWLRFLRGVVDTPDLPLNVSRETLQASPLVAKMRSILVRKVLSELKARATNEDSPVAYETFWDAFGAVLKEGLYEDRERHDDILPLCRFRSSRRDGWVSLSEYVDGMIEGQEAIYYLTGDTATALAASPQLEGFRARGIEVLLLTDPIDEFWPLSVTTFDGKPLRSAADAGTDLSTIPAPDSSRDRREDVDTDVDKPAAPDVTPLVARLKSVLGDAVADVRPSSRLTDSAVCLVATEGALSPHLARMLRHHGRDAGEPDRRVLEINPGHALVRALAGLDDTPASHATLQDAAWLLLDQARILEGDPPPDPAAFARRLTGVLQRGLMAA